MKKTQPDSALSCLSPRAAVLRLALGLFPLAVCGVPDLHAATVTASPVSSGIAYNWGLSLGGADSGAVAGAVGQWSWEDPAAGTGVGWGHTSHWIAVTLTEPAVLQLDLTRNSTVPVAGGGFYPATNYFPSFTLWSSQDKDPGPADFAESPDLVGNWHSYNNDGAVDWAEDLGYLDHFRNTGTQESASSSWLLPAGEYTVVVGGLAPAAVGASRQGYLATFSTSPVPEPGSALFLTLTGLGMLRRRRRERAGRGCH